VDNISYSFRSRDDIQLQLRMEEDLCVLADPVELGRILSNLLENARKYGKTPGCEISNIDFGAIARGRWVLIKIRDHGPGVDPEQLASLTKPFYRGESARTAANGAGLGLAIVEKTVQRMGGAFTLSNSPSGGLAAHIKLRRAPGY
jgi:two-component system osmolarity sensor histidine kinase EnvZ